MDNPEIQSVFESFGWQYIYSWRFFWLKILNKLKWVSTDTADKLTSTFFLCFENKLTLLSEIKKHSSYINFGRVKQIGLELLIITVGDETKLMFWSIPGYIFEKQNGIFPYLVSNRSGWLHTFLNCMTKFIKFSILFLFDAKWKRSATFILFLILSYNTFYRWVMIHYMIASSFGAISCSTSIFSLLNMNG